MAPVTALAWLQTGKGGGGNSMAARALVRDAPWGAVPPDLRCVFLSEGWGNTLLAFVALDLSDPTGRAHAAVWFKAQDVGPVDRWDRAGHQMAEKGQQITLGRMCEASNLAHAFEPMTDAQIVDLRDMCLALAEVLFP